MVLWDWKYQEMMKYFDEVDTHDMHEGDVVIWTGGDGHVAVFDNWDGYDCWYFSQDPYVNEPCFVKKVEMDGIHAFRRKSETPPAPEPQPVITPSVPRDEYKDQVKILKGITELRVRTEPSLNAQAIGYVNPSTEESESFYNVLETTENDGYKWLRISDSNWIAYSDEWEEFYPAKPKNIELEVIEEKDGYVLVDLGKVWIKE